MGNGNVVLITPSRSLIKPSRRSLLKSAAAFVACAPAIIGKADAAYFQGQAYSSAALSCDSVPAGAAAYGFNTCTFSSTFTNLNRVDTANANTSTASTDWWLSNSYGPNVIDGSSLTSNGTYMTIPKGATGNSFGSNHPSLQSFYLQYPSLSNWAGQHGRYFNNGFYVRFVIAFDQTIASGGTGFPAMWGASWPGQSGGEYVETDFIEAFPGVGSVGLAFNVHNWHHSGSSDDYTSLPGFNSGSPVFDGTTQVTFDCLWVPQAKNGGLGLFAPYCNGVTQANNNFNYSSGAPATCSISGTNFNGIFSPIDTAPYGVGLFITCGIGASNANWPMKIWKVEVWQTSMSDMTVI